MNSLSQAEVAWLAGIYEGEGYCGIRSGRNFSVQITMSDHDIMQRVYDLTGIGSLRDLQPRGKDSYKLCKTWVVSSKDGVDFLETILPWLGARRAERAKEAINNWKNNKYKTNVHDTTCRNGHDLTLPGARNTGNVRQGVCVQCRREATSRYRAKKKLLVQCK